MYEKMPIAHGVSMSQCVAVANPCHAHGLLPSLKVEKSAQHDASTTPEAREDSSLRKLIGLMGADVDLELW